MKKILIIAQNLDDMVLDDSIILGKHFEVKTLVIKKGSHLLSKLPSMLSSIRKCDLCFIWFAASYAALAVKLCKIFRKKSVIVTGGYDVVKVPDIKYGMPLHPLKRFFPWFALKFADRILPFSNHSRDELFRNFKVRKEKVEVIHLGVHPLALKPVKAKKENLVVTVGVISWSNLKRKGLRTFVRSAKHVRDAKFLLIGDVVDRSIEHLEHFTPPNVEFKNLGYDTEKILKELSRAKVYVQVSGHEGFGRAMAEAMSRECVPVVTKRGAIPEVVGDTGFYVPFQDENKTAQAIRKALKSKKGKLARKRILELYTLRKREKALIKVIKELI